MFVLFEKHTVHEYDQLTHKINLSHSTDIVTSSLLPSFILLSMLEKNY